MSPQNKPMGLLGAARKAGVTGTAVIVAGAALAGCSGLASTQTETQQVSFDHQIERIEFHLDSGGITLTPGDQGRVGIDRKLTWTEDRPSFTEEWQGNVLKITSTCDGRHCSADYTVRVPAAVAVKAFTEAGTINAQAIQGDQELQTGAGDIKVSDAAGRLSATTKAGNITAGGLSSGVASADTQSGNLNLGFAKAPSQVTARSQAGNVKVTVPRDGQQYKVEADTKAGRKDVDVAQAPAGPGTITVHSDAGDVSVHSA
ncbi:DUF4097 family beta strand repeat-containing protein [Kitasatospora sp. NPDC059463]|uniref:DUF4097 family beta strand repeat-containing protein n=1 Tax=unclassified Kitasatospora TaxID=2633591 RepID=UPI0036873382